jgi:signal transduction histidine kinase/DNA-binding response OmpR family regulator
MLTSDAPPTPGAARRGILVVDDDRDVAAVIAEHLEAAGHQVTVATSGTVAMAIAEAGGVDLVLLDLRMPEVDGLTLLPRLRALSDAPDVVIVTGYATLESAMAAIDAGASGYVEKPVDRARLLHVVARALERRRLVRHNSVLAAELDKRRRHAEALAAISTMLASTLDLQEAMRRVCRELARLFAADTVSAYTHDVQRDLLVPTAAYRVPKDMLAELTRITLPLDQQGFHLPLWRDRRPVWSDDVGHDARFADSSFRRFPHQSAIVLPLILDGEVAGAFYLVWWRDRRRPDAEELLLAEQVSHHASLLLGNARLFERAERDRRRLETLNEVSRRLAELHETDEMLSLIVEQARSLLGMDGAVLRLLETDALVLRACTGAGLETLATRAPLSVGASLAGRVVVTGVPVAVDDVERDDRFDAREKEIPIELGLHAWLGVPLWTRSAVTGVLMVTARSPRSFADDEVALLAAFGDQASLALEKGRLLEQQATLYAASRAREREAQVLYEVASGLASTVGLEDILDRITAKTLEVVGGDAVGILGYDDAREMLVFRRGLHLDAQQIHGLGVRPGEGVGGRAFVERRPVWTDDRLADPELRYTAQTASTLPATTPRAYLGVPIESRGEVFGVLMLYHRAPHVFTEDEVRLLSVLAHHAAVGMDRARLFGEIENQRHRLAEIFDSTSDGMMLVGRDGQVIAANRRAGELLGFDASNVGDLGLTGMLARHFATQPDFAAQVDPITVVLDAGREGDGDLDLPLAGRTLHWVARPAAAPGVSAVTLTFHDVTQEREISRMKSDFVSFVTHQLRTPLTGIKWMLELAGEALQGADEAASYVRDAREAAERLIQLVNELLDVSRLESGKVRIVLAPVDLAAVTRAVVTELAGMIKDRGHRVKIDAADVGAIALDEQLIRQVVLNFISNAVKYTPPGGSMEVRIARHTDGIAWSVTDSGIGIPSEALGRMFEKFFRADNVIAIETEGTGLGLYLTKLIVERFGGRVWCDSIQGEGSTFGFTVPA